MKAGAAISKGGGGGGQNDRGVMATAEYRFGTLSIMIWDSSSQKHAANRYLVNFVQVQHSFVWSTERWGLVNRMRRSKKEHEDTTRCEVDVLNIDSNRNPVVVDI